MTLSLNFPPVAPHIVLSAVKPLSVVRDPTNNHRYLTLASSEEEEWDDGTEQEGVSRDTVQAVFLSCGIAYSSALYKVGELVELDRDLKVILEPAELKILKEDDLIQTAGVTAHEVSLLKAGQKIQAIKAIRERTGHGLKDAKGIADRAQSILGY